MAETRKSGVKRSLSLFGVVVVLVLGAYGYGRWQGLQTVHSVESQTDASLQNVTAGSAQAESEAGALRARVEVLEARRQLHRALMALDGRNFGIARAYLEAAGRHLAAVQIAPPGADPAVLSRLAQELQSARLVAAENFADQTNRILAWIRELDAQLPTDPADQPAGTAPVNGEPAETGSASPAQGAAPTAPAPAAPAPSTGSY